MDAYLPTYPHACIQTKEEGASSAVRAMGIIRRAHGAILGGCSPEACVAGHETVFSACSVSVIIMSGCSLHRARAAMC